MHHQFMEDIKSIYEDPSVQLFLFDIQHEKPKIIHELLSDLYLNFPNRRFYDSPYD
jgi:hypothetical protein